MQRRKPKMHLGETRSPADLQAKDRLRAETPVFETDYQPARKKDDAVYFLSNRYLGQQYLTPDAIRAGYSLDETDAPTPAESIVEFTERKLFEHGDPDRLILQAESRLLHALAKFPQARAAMRTAYSTATFGPANLRWTSEERGWLFSCLTGSPAASPLVPPELLDRGTPEELRSHLIGRGDCPKNAFNGDSASETDAASGDFIETTAEPSTDTANFRDDPGGKKLREVSIDSPEVEIMHSEEEELDSFLETSPQAEIANDETVAAESALHAPNGSLDDFFLEEPDMFPSFTDSVIADETRAELTVQETVATLLCATAKKRFAIAKSKLTNIVSEMDRRLTDGDGNEGESKLSGNEFADAPPDELQDLFSRVGNEVLDAQRSLYEAERSADRVNSHLLDYTVSDGVQSRQSQAGLDRLDRMMEEFIESLPEDSHRPETRGDDGSYVFGSDEFDDKINPMFGGRNPDEYVVQGLPDGESKFE